MQQTPAALFNRALILAASAMLLTLLTAVVSAATTWVKIKASTTDEIVDAFLTASRTGTPTYIVVAPGDYRFTQTFDTGFGLGVLPPVTTRVSLTGAGAGITTFHGLGPENGRIFTVTTGGRLVVRNMTLTHGTAYVRDVPGGGAAANLGGYLAFYDCLLLDNAVGMEQGGAITSMGGSLGLERVTVMNNRVEDSGGGVAVMGGKAGIRDSIISGNEAGAYGGGIYVADGAAVTIARSTVSGNRTSRAGGGGGGIANAGTVWLTDSAVTENIALNEVAESSIGGGISNGGVMRIKNGTVAANEAGTGGGIFNRGRPLFLEGVTIVRNQSCPMTFEGACGGGGVWNEGRIVSVRSLFANNTLLRQGDPDAVGPDCGGRIESKGHNAIGDASGCVLLKPTNDQVGVDPRIGELQDNGEPGNAHFPLLPDSPLIDSGGPRGTDLCTFTDQIGQPRVDGNKDGVRECDIGAIEFQAP